MSDSPDWSLILGERLSQLQPDEVVCGLGVRKRLSSRVLRESMMKCLIIAAGKGSRLRPRGDSKPLIPILGVPMIERVIRSALEAGTDDF
jgi:hypothetical protein